jgi:hypothetical protein
MHASHVTGRPLPFQIKTPCGLGTSWNLKLKASDGIIEVLLRTVRNAGIRRGKMQGFLIVQSGDILVITGS